MTRIKEKKAVRELIAKAKEQLEALKATQQELYEWADDQELGDAEEGAPADAWTAVESLGENLDEIDRPIEELVEALDA